MLFLQAASAQLNPAELDQELRTREKALGGDVAAILWKGDTVVYKKETGSFKSSVQAPVGGSSKLLTAALVMQFVDEGKLSLDDKVAKWLPEFERYNKNYITIRLCLSHMTGIDDKGNRNFASLEEEANALAARKIRTNPGQDFWYGDIGLTIAGRVLEVISKRRFDLLIKQKLFTPLGMRKTTFSNKNGGSVDPSAGALSTADDLIQFLGMLLNKGKYKGQQILSEESVNTLLQVQTKPALISYAPPPVQGYNYALGGWALEEKNAKTTALAMPDAGNWPVIDFCRGYAWLVFVKSPLSKEQMGIHADLKKAVDKQLRGACP